MSNEHKLRLSIDVGGTFTDVVLEEGSVRWTTKVLTTPSAPELGVLHGISEILKLSSKKIEQIDAFVHGTTLATNAIIERRGARTALLATEGFRDVLAIGTEGRYDQYDLALVRPRPLVDRPLRLAVPERMNARGVVLLELDERALAAVIEKLDAERVESVAIAFLHSYANSAHELRAKELLQAALPHVYVSLSSEVCPEIREYERTSTTVANAYVQPLMDGYLARMEEQLVDLGFWGSLTLMSSGGGLTSVELARRFPIRLVESGPAGGAVFASQIAARLNEPKVIAFDMGGTTAKVSLIRDFSSSTSRLFEVDRAARFLKGSGLPITIPVIEMVEIGAGGGSIAHLDSLKRVTVGPESASSVPGPACYNKGGVEPAVTDADLVLGLIDPKTFAGGSVTLSKDLSNAALKRAIGDPLGLSAEMSAYAVYEMVCENMASAARAHTVEKGVDPSDHTMIAFGGAAPLHVARVAEKIGARRVIVPRNAGVGSAVGFLAAPISYEIVRTRHMRLDEFDATAASDVIESLASDVRSWVETAAKGASVSQRYVAFMRYVGQGHEISVELPVRKLEHADQATLREIYEFAYETLFNRSIPAAAIEIVAWSVSCTTEPLRPQRVEPVVPKSVEIGSTEDEIFDGARGEYVPVRRYQRAEIPIGAMLEGPAIIAEQETSTYITESFNAWIDGLGSIVMQSKESVQ